MIWGYHPFWKHRNHHDNLTKHLYKHIVWTNNSDLSRGHPKWWSSKGSVPKIPETFRFRNYSNNFPRWLFPIFPMNAIDIGDLPLPCSFTSSNYHENLTKHLYKHIVSHWLQQQFLTFCTAFLAGFFPRNLVLPEFDSRDSRTGVPRSRTCTTMVFNLGILGDYI